MTSSDPYLDAHNAAQQRLETLNYCLGEQQAERPAPWPADMLDDYCGCSTCVVREVLHAALVYLPAPGDMTEAEITTLAPSRVLPPPVMNNRDSARYVPPPS